MRECVSLQRSLSWCEGVSQLPGVRRRVYFVSKGLVVVWPVLERDGLGRVSDAKYRGNFVLAEGALWAHIDVNIAKSALTSEPQGEGACRMQVNKAVLAHNGVDVAATAAAGLLNNSDLVVVVEDMAGRFRVLGNERWRTLTTVSQDQGGGGNAAGTTIEVEAPDMVAAPFYKGWIETAEGRVYPSDYSGGDADKDDEVGLYGLAVGIASYDDRTGVQEDVTLPVAVKRWEEGDSEWMPSWTVRLSRELRPSELREGMKIGAVRFGGKDYALVVTLKDVSIVEVLIILNDAADRTDRAFEASAVGGSITLGKNGGELNKEVYIYIDAAESGLLERVEISF